MTESDWLTSTNPRAMLESLRGKVSDRKLRLFAVACCARIRRLLTDPRSQNAVEIAEQFADGKVTEAELIAADSNAGAAVPDKHRGDRAHAACWMAYWASDRLAWDAAWWILTDHDTQPLSNKSLEATLLRDVFGNPFRRVTIDRSWLKSNNGTVAQLSRAIYQERAFDGMPILGDALEDAGCSNTDILSHCRQHPAHARGCWLVDLLLRKK